jgi:hypothetical protein
MRPGSDCQLKNEKFWEGAVNEKRGEVLYLRMPEPKLEEALRIGEQNAVRMLIFRSACEMALAHLRRDRVEQAKQVLERAFQRELEDAGLRS